MIGTRNPGCRQIIDNAFRQAAVLPTYVFRSDDTPTIQGLIGSGLAYAVLPLLTVDENDPNVAVIPIRPEPPPRRLGIAWHPERRPPALPPAFRQRGSRNLSRPPRPVGGIARRVTTGYRAALPQELVSHSARSPGDTAAGGDFSCVRRDGVRELLA